MWELLLGSIAAITTSGSSLKRGAFRFGGIFSALGVVMIVASFLTIPNDENFPGIRPLLPCAGAVAVLLFGGSAGIAYGLLANRAVTYVGKISYSLYLWHWPVLVLYRYVSLESRIVLLAAIMLGIAVASYHWIETPMRRSFPGSWKLLVTMPALVGLCLLPIRFGSESPILPKTVAGIDSPESFSRGWEFESTEQLRKGEPGV
jgi:peptidoglycan/LPS O-acetylase OafA/YrhL